MRLLTFHQDGDLHTGVLTADGVADLGVNDFNTLLALTPAELERLATGPLVQESDIRLGPCVPSPGKIICVGLNYRRHAEETGAPVPTTPILFSKFGNALAASGDDVPLPDVAQEYDYEAELGVVIGRRAHRVSEAEALDHVWGYFNCNDVSARDLQMRTTQWLLGKTLDRFLPAGPYAVSADEVGDPQALPVRSTLNGELRQDSNTSDMVFGVAELVSYISRHLALEPGDLIATGTPEGVILGRGDGRWMVPGDEIVVEVGNLGRLCNRLVR
jgi:2-keto-4-pentenoate hydratase/2-oxohepta-3-ene-1,7-dioic acid hydratase in catechol pathway